jgi:dihydrofolate reductase
MTTSPTTSQNRVIGLIWAQTLDGVIGKDNDMPWHLPEDLAHFKRITMGHPVIMGRNTWDALPETWRPLPGRSNIVLTRNASWRADGAIAVHSLDAALAAVDALGESAGAAGIDTGINTGEVWIIGGQKVFVDAVDVATVALVTELDLTEDGDAFAPKLGDEWVRESMEPAEGWALSKAGIRYRIVRYRKR